MNAYSKFANVLHTAWCAETCYKPDLWSLENPSWGQCAVTSLVVHDHFGGDILYSRVRQPDGYDFGHYFNRVGGLNIDFTRSQFPTGTIYPVGKEDPRDCQTTRDYILSYIDTVRRYELLKDRLEKSRLLFIV